MRRHLLLPLVAVLPCHAAIAAETSQPMRMEEVVVTAPMMEEPLTVTTDPKAPRQPVPAHDGADFLKTIPGFSVIRKGGTDGDPVFRGMAASRLNILSDGASVLGGCGMRMDPPTAYIFPESYDKITVLKGPQTVLYGGGNSAGTVLFERNIKRFQTPGMHASGSLMFGSFDRNDQVASATLGNPNGYLQANGTRSDANDYEDGNGTPVHSAYTRWNFNGIAGWTPDDNTRLELSVDRSDGEAAYADRSMDGVKFDRTGYGVKLEKKALTPLLEKVEAQIYHSYVDHVMDNYTLRPLTGMKMVSNPDRTTDGARLAFGMRPSQPTRLTVGLDYQRNEHTLRSTVNYASMPRVPDMQFDTTGLFGEVSHDLSLQERLLGGLRMDWTEAKDERTGKTTSGMTDQDTNTAAFLRYERDMESLPATAYIGLGRAVRSADYWERTRNPAATSMTVTGAASTFMLNPETTTQLDVGLIHGTGRLRVSLSGFYARINDYILIRQINMFASDARNVDATTYGGEADLAYTLSRNWKINGTLAYVHGDNDTDHTPLAQLPPLEGRIGLNYDDKVYSFGALLRLVAELDRVQVGYGNIVGQDIGRTPGFNILSVNAGYRPKKNVLIAAGIDNLFDKIYAEHISRTGTAISGFTTTTRVNEPGRNIWLKLNIAME
jgi:iron complex outermembrane receptor protein